LGPIREQPPIVGNEEDRAKRKYTIEVILCCEISFEVIVSKMNPIDVKESFNRD